MDDCELKLQAAYIALALHIAGGFSISIVLMLVFSLVTGGTK